MLSISINPMNLSNTAEQLLSVVAREGEHRLALARLVLEKRQLIIKLKDDEGLHFWQIGDLLGGTTRQRAEAIYKGRKPKEKTKTRKAKRKAKA